MKKRSKEEKEAEKEERRERKREKNRRKRLAYRLRQRMKKANPKPSKAKKEDWKKENKESNREYRNEKKRKQKWQQRQQQESRRREPKPVLSESEWTKLVEEAGDRSDFEVLLQLFSQHLCEHGKRSGGNPSKSVLKRFRELSTRYHPDKHSTETARYSLMFQALNEARDIYCS
eukprot:CAMPEP_0113607734 /NCGR_PEP_ID=MMETSP0017_2-20120614/3545_1 /TAXON_ID=2856 /ORGANISM="Cylindrotheca closterium" /LENGTH=173 /DNA_ID=CAMNT_0000516363 /DNA_START=621 /DNA_END=1142 /DNA_ORIENTATION=+ /assembly_acc=CAM_ASM_000147